MTGYLLRATGSFLLLLGAFAVGGVLHGIIEGEFGYASPVVILGLLAGVAFIAVGRRLERTVASGDSTAEENDDAEFDEELSPVPTAALDERERDTGREE